MPFDRRGGIEEHRFFAEAIADHLYAGRQSAGDTRWYATTGSPNRFIGVTKRIRLTMSAALFGPAMS